MSTLLRHSKIPLWAVIVIIAVGSVVVLAVVIGILRCWYLRCRRNNSRFLGSPDAPTRRVTIRRGRIIPSSKRISLTGSEFGVGAFHEDLESVDTGVRSKSPFDWFRNRSQTPQSQMTQVGSTLSEHATSPEPVYFRSQQLDHGNSPRVGFENLSPTFRSHSPQSPIESLSIQISPLAGQRPSRNTNFSRAFVARRQYNYPPSPKSTRLEMLAEDDNEEGIEHSMHIVEDSEKFHPIVETRETTPTIVEEPVISQSLLSSPSTSLVRLPSSDGSFQDLARTLSQKLPQSNLRNQLRRPTSAVSESSLTYRQPEQSSQLGSDEGESVRPSRSVEELRKSESGERIDHAVVRKPSKKGKVLRKKSLQRAEKAAMVAT